MEPGQYIKSMPLFARPERDAVARQISDGLDAYKLSIDDWLATPGNLDQYEKVSAEIESLRVMSLSALPEATCVLADLLLAHTDLTFLVLKQHLVRVDALRATPEAEGQLSNARERHRCALLDMQSLCARLSVRGRR
jgi:hypothetical protein